MKIIIEKEHCFYIQFDFNKRINYDIVKLPDVQYDSKYKRWECPLYYRNEVFSFGEKHGFNLPEGKSKRKIFDEPVGEMPKLNVDIKLNLAPYDYQKEGIAYSLEKGSVINGDACGLGKAQPLYSKIATPNGFVQMGDIRINDEIFGMDGSICHVTDIFPQGVRDIYRVTFTDGNHVDCDKEHLWAVRDGNWKRRHKEWAVKSVAEILDMGVTYAGDENFGNSKFEIPICSPVQYEEKKYYIHPYILGVLIGDGYLGGKNSICFSTPDMDIEIKNRVESLTPSGYGLRVNRHPACPQYNLTKNNNNRRANLIKQEIKRLKLNVKSGLKFIPEEYLHGSISQRFDLLRGLMDTDGSCRKNRSAFHSTSKILCEDIMELVHSLGGISRLNKYDRTKDNKGIEYQVSISMNTPPFYSLRKLKDWKSQKMFRRIVSIDFIGVHECQCIKVDSQDHLYLTDNFVVTHNTMQAIATVIAHNLFPCLIICPASLKLNWEQEWLLWTNDHKPLILTDSVKHTWPVFYDMGMFDVFIVNYESLKKYFVVNTMVPPGEKLGIKHVNFHPSINIFKSTITDECHRIKEPSAMQTKLTYGITRGKLNLLLSGTPVVNKPVDLLTQLMIIDKLHHFGGVKNFKEMAADNERWPEINYILRTNCYFRREKRSVLKDLPDLYRQKVYCEIDNQDEYSAAEADLARYLKEWKQATDMQVARSMRGKVMVQIGVMKNISARGKLTDVMSYIDDVVDSGEKIIIFIYLHEVVNKLKEHYPKALYFTGKESEQQRNQAVHDFQKCKVCDKRYERHSDESHDFEPSEHQLIFVNYAAGGVGITLTAADKIAHVELPWTPKDVEQDEGRAHRISQKNAVQDTFFIGKNTIDEYIYQIIADKREMSGIVTGAEDLTEESVMENVLELLMKGK